MARPSRYLVWKVEGLAQDDRARFREHWWRTIVVRLLLRMVCVIMDEKWYRDGIAL